MNSGKGKLIAYWIITTLLAASYALGGIMYVGRVPQAIEGVIALGYPVYFIVLLGAWKALGTIAIMIPRTPLLKEWAYAGMFFNLTGAAISNGVMAMGIQHVITPLVLLLFVVTSWWLRPASRRLA